MPEIEKEKILLDDKLVIEEGHIRDENGETYTRLRVKRQDAVAVLLLNADSGKVVLTRQFRYPLAEKTVGDILEIPAGKIDGEDGPVETLIREAEEETGYKVSSENIRHLVTCFTTPGYSTERMHVYFATVTDSDKIAPGGGKADENERIEIVEMDKDEFDRLIRNGIIADAKTCLAGLMYGL